MLLVQSKIESQGLEAEGTVPKEDLPGLSERSWQTDRVRICRKAMSRWGENREDENKASPSH